MCFLYAWDDRHDDRILVHSRYRLSVGNGRSFHADCFFYLRTAGAARDRHVESGDQRGVGHCQRDTRRIRLCQYADLRRRAGVYRRPLRVEFHLRRNSCLRRFGVADVDDYLESRSRRLRCGKKIHSRIRKEFESRIFFIFVCLHTIIPENRCRWIPNTN